MHDFIVVGSGCSGAIAAATLIEKGARVLMLDVGDTASTLPYATSDVSSAPDFIAMRTQDPEQHRTLVGDDAHAVAWSADAAGPQLTPGRSHLLRNAHRLLRFDSTTFQPLESLAYGGLGAAWGLGCCVYSAAELAAAGLPNMQDEYQWVADHIGISGSAHDGTTPSDDATPYTADRLSRIQAPIRMDPPLTRMHARYNRSRAWFHDRGFRLGRTALALLTEDRDGRRAHAYRDMDFYDDADASAYRPWLTIDELRKHNQFEYRAGVLVTHYTESADGAVVHGIDPTSGDPITHTARTIIIAAGVLSTARIVLRSVPQQRPLGILCNAYSYMPCIQPGLLGAHDHVPRTGFAQLSLFHDADGTQHDVAMASIYSYRELMLYRIARALPLPYSDAMPIARYLIPALTIAGIHHPDTGDGTRTLSLRPAADSITGDTLHAEFAFGADAQAAVRRRETLFARAFRHMGAFPLRGMATQPGASIHYAGTLRYTDSGDPLTLHDTGRISGTSAVYVADASGFRFLPAKGPTLTLMANARRTALEALHR